MNSRLLRQGRRIRTLFVSDLHLGCRHAHAREFLDMIQHCHPERIYLVGDIIDGWKLKKSFLWEPVYNDILARLFEMSQMGTRLYYTPGNHDAFLRKYSWNFDFIRVADEFVFRGLDGRRFLVTHGDYFDCVEQSAAWVSWLASFGYDALLSLNWLWSRLRKTSSGSTYSLSATVKRKVKQIVRYVSDFEQRLTAHARKQGCDGVICGHIHTPVVANFDGIAYCNSGDWVENCTAFVEYEDGTFELLHYFDQGSDEQGTIDQSASSSGQAAADTVGATVEPLAAIVAGESAIREHRADSPDFAGAASDRRARAILAAQAAALGLQTLIAARPTRAIDLEAIDAEDEAFAELSGSAV